MWPRNHVKSAAALYNFLSLKLGEASKKPLKDSLGIKNLSSANDLRFCVVPVSNGEASSARGSKPSSVEC